MRIEVLFDTEFAEEFAELAEHVQNAMLKGVKALEVEGPRLGRPWVDTLKGSAHANMKELRVTARKVEWRVAFAFDPIRQALLLAAAAKGGKKESRVYERLIRVADMRFSAHLATLKSSKGG